MSRNEIGDLLLAFYKRSDWRVTTKQHDQLIDLVMAFSKPKINELNEMIRRVAELGRTNEEIAEALFKESDDGDKQGKQRARAAAGAGQES